ncbi:MAG: DUF2147 domain-containing protein [Oleispira sp.]|nr:DUF2147 domain-containing protein [Oleispira sp.]MBL4799717.1 DUF2147 domain-containing protein [Oleispira sp.]MBL4880776.1 DUF2147 domain-containing protein [Oleispira sp.]
MRIFQLISAATLFLFASVSWAQDPVLGQWHTIDDETNKIKSLVTLSVAEDGTIVGVITKILKEKEEGEDGLCRKCEGDLKDQPIEGMKFMWGFKKIAEGQWEEGKLLDPESGDVYSGNINITDDPSKLDIRGYVGISLFGRSQTWEKVEAAKI